MLFTLTITTYNRSKLLKRCLDSIVMQDFDDFEVWILDDCSSDDTSEIVKAYLKDSRFHYKKEKKNLGFGDKVFHKALTEGLFLGQYLLLLSDDEYLYNAKHLSNISNALSCGDIDFVIVDQGFDYGGIVVFPENAHYPLPKTFIFEELTETQKQMLQDKIKVVYKQDFIKKYDFFDANKQDKGDVCFEVSYYDVYKHAKMAYVSGVAHIFGVTPNARRKYISFFNWIVSSGMSIYGERDRERFYQRLSRIYTDYSMVLNAFFDWGGDSLAKSLSYFSKDVNFPTYLKQIAQNYQECFQGRLEEEYERFNTLLLSEEEREEAIRNAKNVVIYGDGTWRRQIEEYLKAKGKTIAFIVDDYKLGAIRAEDMIWQDTPYDLIFIASASPKVIYEVFKKLKYHNNITKVATILARDEIG